MLSRQALADAFVNVTLDDATAAEGRHAAIAYDGWKKHNSAEAANGGLALRNILRDQYPGYSLVATEDTWSFNLFGFPDLLVMPLPDEQLDTLAGFVPFMRRSGQHGGIILENVEFGGFTAAWKSYDFLIYVATWPEGFGRAQQFFILHKGPERVAAELLIAVATWSTELHDEVLVFDQGYWRKDAGLFAEIQKASWDDVILEQKFKDAIQYDISSFWKNEPVYKELGVPWKRGLIFYGPAGNGKTISLKAAMSGSDNPLLYVRSFQSWMGDEAAMEMVFGMARQFAPCFLIIEDIDSHITERNRSFFLNQLDGLDNNDGLLLITTTNHLERLDGSLANRPSRFDRKYLFDDPNEDERALYCGYWQRKLKNNKNVDFPDELAREIAKMSQGFSFAYLKEAFVSTLILLAGDSSLKFDQTIKSQVKDLRDQLKHRAPDTPGEPSYPGPGGPGTLMQPPSMQQNKRTTGGLRFANNDRKDFSRFFGAAGAAAGATLRRWE